ncbi:hypothetical protein HGM15179_020106 [Zosterops borbonicus]|uniref:Uncharacterized protein n=1 Tax=Zosterops borbonicus TaxID=364589 RepID=A0A8K1D9C5_9PASS|nr:hypothetical protein HGM15179_021948 [Zosterops borbonicus]TRZ07001.1 hypothetical protein HGM15179_020106 [Zosterops borbonicus]
MEFGPLGDRERRGSSSSRDKERGYFWGSPIPVPGQRTRIFLGISNSSPRTKNEDIFGDLQFQSQDKERGYFWGRDVDVPPVRAQKKDPEFTLGVLSPWRRNGIDLKEIKKKIALKIYFKFIL